MAKHNNKLFFWLSLIFGFVMGVVMILFFGSGSAHAQTNQRVTPTNPCALYASLQNSPSNKVVKVQVLGSQNGVVGVMVLGLPRKVNATLNGMDISRLKSDSRQIVCGAKAVGELSSYDLRSTNMDAGYFQIQADHLSDGQSVTISNRQLKLRLSLLDQELPHQTTPCVQQHFNYDNSD